MENKVVVVTGAATGLGKTFAKAFLESGCTSLAIVDVNKQGVEAVATELRTTHTGAEVQPYACDVSVEDDVQAAFKDIATRWGTIHSLVTSAGYAESIPTLQYPTSKLRRIFEINVYGSLFCAREAAQYMIKAKTPGTIVLIGSVAANAVPIPQPQAPYNASKAAIKQLTASLAVEWAPHQIRVNALSPGYMATEMVKAIADTDPGLMEKWMGLTPMRRIGNPEDLKGAIIYLASDASEFMTGAELRVDGGYSVV